MATMSQENSRETNNLRNRFSKERNFTPETDDFPIRNPVVKVDDDGKFHLDKGDPLDIPRLEDTPHKTLILCLDGTGDQFDDENSNVMKLYSCLRKDHPKQKVYYQTGIGTTSNPAFLTSLTRFAAQAVDSAIAWYLQDHIVEAYCFIQEFYEPGDRICIFGFSRGAYTARALAGFLNAVGLLPPGMQSQVPFAYKLWADGNDKFARSYYRKLCNRQVIIEYLGVWDTVSSVGAVIPRTLPFSTSNKSTKIFRHAIALDERRAKFRANTWHNKFIQVDHQSFGWLGEVVHKVNNLVRTYVYGVPEKEAQRAIWKQKKKDAVGRAWDIVNDPDERRPSWMNRDEAQLLQNLYKTPREREPIRERHKSEWMVENEVREQIRKIKYLKSLGYKKGDQLLETWPDVREVWFAGGHCDVGGGVTPDLDIHALSYVPFRWMVKEFLNAKIPVAWDPFEIDEYGLIVPEMATWNRQPERLSLTDPELIHYNKEYNDQLDIEAPITDKLNTLSWWWPLELVPFFRHLQKPVMKIKDGRKVWKWKWYMALRANLFRPRIIPFREKPLELDVQSYKLWLESKEKNQERPYFHTSVKRRMESDNPNVTTNSWLPWAQPERYRPLAWPSAGEPEYVD